MLYGQFKSVEQVAGIFNIKVKDGSIINSKSIEISELLLNNIERRLLNSLSFRNEATICNKVITPMLNIVEENNKPLNVWIEEPFDVDKEKCLRIVNFLLTNLNKTSQIILMVKNIFLTNDK